jgi:asparagine synthase (glutamine-hydrolysing)
MCGLSLIVSEGSDPQRIEEDLRRMGAVQQHRGPDDQGHIVERLGARVVGIGLQRLSINDLSRRGHQPMVSPCGRYVIAYNGEVYNYLELAKELAGDPVLAISDGDTAVVLAAIIRWGAGAFGRFNGMWAIAFLDRQERRILLSRDRMGVKPLYIFQGGGRLVVASEIKTILAAETSKFTLHAPTVARYLAQSLTNTTDDTFFSEIRCFPAASFAELSLTDCPRGAIDSRRFWQHPFEAGLEVNQHADAEELRALLIDSVRVRLRSEVPVGVLLSGGLDSSAILGAARNCMPEAELSALSVVSDDPETSEESYIDAMVRHTFCKVLKTRIDSDPVSTLDELDEACWYSDQPVASLSVVGHRLMMRAAREQGLVVLLTGQGSDEQLAGYNKYLYFYLMACMRNGRLIPALGAIAGFLWRGTVFKEFRVEEARRYIPMLSRRVDGHYMGEALRGAQLAETGGSGSFAEREYRDLASLSIPMLLHYEDRMSMSWSREVRVPFLDYRIVEYLARVPGAEKLRRGWTKAPLRAAIGGLVPELVRWRRDKKGFSVPEKQWAKSVFVGRFREMFRDGMLAEKLRLVRPARVRELYEAYLRGSHAVTYKEIFSIYCLEVWLRRYAAYLST